VTSAAENSIKFLKTRFWEEKSVEDVLTLGLMPQATLVRKWWACIVKIWIISQYLGAFQKLV
jgi:hypothetical protein